MKWHRKLRDALSSQAAEKKNRIARRVLLQLEELETRALLSASSATAAQSATAPTNNEVVQPQLQIVTPQNGTGSNVSSQQAPAISGYSPQQIRQAYGLNTLFNGGNFAIGETIAIVDAYNDPNIYSDLVKFDAHYGLGNPTLTVMNQNGQVLSTNGKSTTVTPPSADPSGGWELEESLDVEWAKSMAPGANILLVVANSANNSDLFSAVKTAAAQKGVVVVSMSWGMNEASGESSYDSYFQPKSSTNPNGSNPGVVFVAAAGDSGGYYPLYPYDNSALYPSVSPYVFSVGGTTLNLTSTNNYSSEMVWSGGGGGPAQYEGEPSYQYNQPSIGSSNVQYGNTYYSARSAPDVSYNADPNTGYAVYDSVAAPNYGFNGGWTEVGGTSAGAPQWSALVALTDSYRSVHDGGKAPLDAYQVQTTLYNTLGTSNYGKIFHDTSTGSNGPWNAGSGYDWASGLGTPITNNLVPFLAGTTVSRGLPSIKGSGYGAVSSSFGSTGSSSTTYFASTSGGSQGGGGLYANSGSISIAPVSPSVNGLNGQTAGAPLMPFAVLSTFSFSARAAATSSTPTNASNFVGNVPTLTSGSPSPATASTTSAAATNALASQSNTMLGASGWNATGLSSRMSGLGTPDDGIIDQRADEMNGNLEDVGDFSPDSAIDDSGGDWSILDATAPPLFDGEAADAGDAGAGGE